DNSGSMGEEQENLISNFPKFIEVLDNFEPEPGANISYRVGLTTASVTRKFTSTTLIPGFPPASTKVNEKGQDGAFVNASECGLSQPWIEGPEASASSEFSCMGNVGAMGSSYEMPLAAMELALGKQTAQGGANEGFYRKGEDSLLVVVIITDEDDCSVEEGGTLIADSVTGSDCNPAKCKGLYAIDDSKMFLDELTGGEGRYVVTAIAGPGPKACSSTFGNAIYARRMNQFIQLVGAYGVFGNICSGDLWSSLKDALSVIKVACKGLRPR
ncbi:MAG: hypothetical protein MUC50_07015, partial [Myxococcota bacterium]|nr:hypothetical protein [Myxococcota bacterium]